jgi:solute:Na+ symporter, SSS family
MSTQSSLINWGSSFIVNDFVLNKGTKGQARQITRKQEIWISRIVTLCLFALAAMVAMLFVEGMIGWFIFINSAMVMFLLPLSWLRFFWWRFNVWGELAAVVLGLPLAIFVWFILDFQSRPIWQGLGLLFFLSVVVLIVVTLLTPPESKETLLRFYNRCRPPGLWGPIREMSDFKTGDRSTGNLVFDCVLGILACLGLVLATNSIFVGAWGIFFTALALCIVSAAWLIYRIWDQPIIETTVVDEFSPPEEVAVGGRGSPRKDGGNL